MRKLTTWELFGLYVLGICALFYGIEWLRDRLPPHDPPPDGPVDNNLL